MLHPHPFELRKLLLRLKYDPVGLDLNRNRFD